MIRCPKKRRFDGLDRFIPAVVEETIYGPLSARKLALDGTAAEKPSALNSFITKNAAPGSAARSTARLQGSRTKRE
jgi:hypothetical protein